MLNMLLGNVSNSENYHPGVQTTLKELPPPNHGVAHESTDSVKLTVFLFQEETDWMLAEDVMVTILI